MHLLLGELSRLRCVSPKKTERAPMAGDRCHNPAHHAMLLKKTVGLKSRLCGKVFNYHWNARLDRVGSLAIRSGRSNLLPDCSGFPSRAGREHEAFSVGGEFEDRAKLNFQCLRHQTEGLVKESREIGTHEGILSQGAEDR